MAEQHVKRTKEELEAADGEIMADTPESTDFLLAEGAEGADELESSPEQQQVGSPAPIAMNFDVFTGEAWAPR
jgi:hypothetical protein